MLILVNFLAKDVEDCLHINSAIDHTILLT